MCLFLHKHGYTYFSIPNLIYPEIESLVDAKNRQTKKQEQEQKKMARKNKINKGRYRR